MSTCGCICMFSLSCSSGYMSDLLVPFTNKCNTKLCFKYIELLFLECEIIFREKKWQEWLRQNLNDRVLICINRLESFVEPGNRAKSGSKRGKMSNLAAASSFEKLGLGCRLGLNRSTTLTRNWCQPLFLFFNISIFTEVAL